MKWARTGLGQVRSRSHYRETLSASGGNKVVLGWLIKASHVVSGATTTLSLACLKDWSLEKLERASKEQWQNNDAISVRLNQTKVVRECPRQTLAQI